MISGCSRKPPPSDPESIIGEAIRSYLTKPDESFLVFLDASKSNVPGLEYSEEIWPGLRPAKKAAIDPLSGEITDDSKMVPGILFQVIDMKIERESATLTVEVRSSAKNGETSRFSFIKDNAKWRIVNKTVLANF